MKKLLFTTIALLIALHAVCQEDKLKELEKLEKKSEAAVKTDTLAPKIPIEITDTLTSPEPLEEPEIEVEEEIQEDQDTVVVEVGDEIFSIKEVGDETRIKIGKKVFRVVENDDGVVVFKSSDNNSHPWHHNHDRFRGHLGGLELGFDGFLTDYWSTTLEPEDSYFDLNTTKSYYWNLLLPCLNIPFSRHFGIAASLGISISKYRFDGNNSIIKGEDGVIGPSYPDAGTTYTKSKFVTTYAILPLILEAQIPVSGSHRTINIGAGLIGAAKLGAHTKVVYYTDGKQKDKNKDDFSLNTFRWGATARIGYEFFQVYGTCYFTSLFEEGKGPDLFPYEVGIAFTIND